MMNGIRKEHKASSGAAKHEKRSGSELPQAAVSPYSSHHELDTIGQTAEGASWLEELSHKSAAKRQTAAAVVMQFLQQYNAAGEVLDNAEGIMLYCTRSIGPTSKASESERLGAVRLGTAFLLSFGDDVPRFYSEFAGALVGALTASKLRSDLCADMIDALSLIYAMDDRLIVDEKPLSKALTALLNVSPTEEMNPSAYAALIRCVAFCGDYRDCLAHVALGLQSAHFDIIIAAVEGVGLANQRFPGSFGVDVVEPLLRTTTKEAGRSKKELLPLVRSVVSSISDGVAPTDSVVMAHLREATVSGFIACYLLELVREIAADGTQRHLVRNATARRFLKISEDFSRPREQNEFIGHHEMRLEKVERQKDRAKDRDIKRAVLSGDDE